LVRLNENCRKSLILFFTSLSTHSIFLDFCFQILQYHVDSFSHGGQQYTYCMSLLAPFIESRAGVGFKDHRMAYLGQRSRYE
jgi:hypothetical protein